jgi:hypothetical protein
MINKLALFITHNIFLTNSQIDELIEKNSCVPVWINSKSRKTTEPASEFFCNYKIINEKQKENEIEIEKKGYKFFLPNSDWVSKEWPDSSEMSYNKRNKLEKEISKWWEENPAPMNLNNLKNSNYLRTQIKKLDQEFPKIKAIVDIQHTIEIKSIESLIKSFC